MREGDGKEARCICSEGNRPLNCPIYDLVGPHLIGTVYTPPWLSAQRVQEVLDKVDMRMEQEIRAYLERCDECGFKWGAEVMAKDIMRIIRGARMAD